MPKLCLILLLFLGAPWLSAQEKVQLLVETDPASTKLVIDGKADQPLSRHEGGYTIGRTQVFKLGETDRTKHAFEFQADGYRSVSRRWSWSELSQLAAQKKGERIQLGVASPGAFFQRYPLTGWTAVLLMVVGAVLTHSRLQRGRLLAEKDKKLQAMTANADVRDPFIMTILGDYRLVQRLGSGGMATVYKGVPADTLDESAAVAVKLIKPEEMSKEFERRFEREIKVSMKLDHPNVVRVVTWGLQEGLHYLVMELVDGCPLTHYLPEKGMSLEEVMKYAPAIFDALAYAHKLGIVHRDLKPDNVMVTKKGLVKLMDFGLARNREVKTVTVTGSVMGTPQYMAPEQIMSGPRTAGLDDRSDQYALGCMLFEMFCGRRPFESDEPMKVIMMHLTAEPPELSTFRNDVPTAVQAVISRLLVKDPKGRYASMHEAAFAFESAVLGPERARPRPASGGNPSPVSVSEPVRATQGLPPDTVGVVVAVPPAAQAQPDHVGVAVPPTVAVPPQHDTVKVAATPPLADTVKVAAPATTNKFEVPSNLPATARIEVPSSMDRA